MRGLYRLFERLTLLKLTSLSGLRDFLSAQERVDSVVELSRTLNGALDVNTWRIHKKIMSIDAVNLITVNALR